MLDVRNGKLIVNIDEEKQKEAMKKIKLKYIKQSIADGLTERIGGKLWKTKQFMSD